MDIPLDRLNYLAIDCQATGNSPKSSFPLEIGWVVFNGDALQGHTPLIPRTLFIQPPDNSDIPAHFTKLTGIDASHLTNAVSDRSALKALKDQMQRIARQDRLTKCPTVIHFARYEMAFLNDLQRRQNASKPLPLDLFCTHQIAARLLPELPRKGLRAVAGVLGHSVPKLKRCHPHLLATAFIWCSMLTLLAHQKKIYTLDQLRHWYTSSKIPKTPKHFPMPKELRLGLPEKPGIYSFKRSNQDVLYIGKARSLKQRINSYYHNSRNHTENISEMLTQALGLETTCTATALEAALLETDAIKQIEPPYNTALTNTHRRLYFISRDFSAHAPHRTKTCPLGPVASLEPFVAARSIGRCIKGRTLGPIDISNILAMPHDHCPAQDCFQDGMAIFRDKFGSLFHRKRIAQGVLQIGRRSWLERLHQHTASDVKSDETNLNHEKGNAFAWTPEAVIKRLEAVCRRCAFMFRRANWLAIVSESTVAWRDRNPGSNRRHIIQFQAGVLTHRTGAHINQAVPVPPKDNTPFLERRAQLNIETYDRLRVLTTEIRRLLRDNRFECIRLSRNTFLYPKQIRLMLDWI
jgi:DNA polymerase III epsilon subunit-like protein